MKKILMLSLLMVVVGCTSYPENIQPIKAFEVDRYLGKWYEIARLDHSFERGLSHVTATYTRNNDGGIKVLNQGFEESSGAWREAEGKAYFVQDEDTAHLKVSFFGPFYGAYVVFELDPEYRHAFIVGNDYSYLWLLSRSPEISPALKQRFLSLAAEKGFDVSQLIWVDHQSDK